MLVSVAGILTSGLSKRVMVTKLQLLNLFPLSPSWNRLKQKTKFSSMCCENSIASKVVKFFTIELNRQLVDICENLFDGRPEPS